MALTIAKTAAKLTIGVGAIYATLDQGVWSSSNQGSKALDKVRTNVIPAANDYFNKAPDIESLSDTAKNKWNDGVQYVFRGISSAPDSMVELSQKVATELNSRKN